MRTLVIAISAAAVLGGCNKGSSTGEPNGPVGQPPSGPVVSSQSGATSDTNSAASTNAAAELATGSAGDLPPLNEGLRFVGRWAADQRLCESKAWVFTDTSLRTPAGSNCNFEKVTQVPGGYDVQATCTAESPPTADVLHIRFAESAKAMLFDSKTISDTGLIFCGRNA